MSQVTVLRAENSNSLESLNNITNLIRNRATQIAQSSGGTSNDATRNWLQAERDLFCVPEATLSENDNQYSISIAAAGYDSSNMEVITTANSVTVRGTANTARIAGGSGSASGASSGSGSASGASSGSGSTSGSSSGSGSGAGGNIVYSDTDSRPLYRRFDLPSSIDTNQVTASMDNGMLTIAAQKAVAGTRRSSAAKA